MKKKTVWFPKVLKIEPPYDLTINSRYRSQEN